MIALEFFCLNKDNRAMWLCLCTKCGLFTIKDSGNLRFHTRSCGCLADESRKATCGNRKQDLTGKKRGRWNIIRENGRDKHGFVLWLCVCDCGQSEPRSVKSGALLQGKSRSCGCLQKEVASRTGKATGRMGRKRPLSMSEKEYYSRKQRKRSEGLHGIIVRQRIQSRYRKQGIMIRSKEMTPEMIAIYREFLKSKRIIKKLKEATT